MAEQAPTGVPNAGFGENMDWARVAPEPTPPVPGQSALQHPEVEAKALELFGDRYGVAEQGDYRPDQQSAVRPMTADERRHAANLRRWNMQ